MTRVRISDEADRALLEAMIFIAQDSPAAAVKLMSDLQTRIVNTLSQFPDAGAKWHDGTRFLTIRRYTFVYRHDVANGEVWVLDVFGPGMDWR